MPSSMLAAVPTVPPPERGDHWLSVPEVRRQLGGLSEAALYKLMRRDDSFPRPVRLFPKKNLWSAKELAAWMDAQLAARAAR